MSEALVDMGWIPELDRDHMASRIGEATEQHRDHFAEECSRPHLVPQVAAPLLVGDLQSCPFPLWHPSTVGRVVKSQSPPSTGGSGLLDEAEEGEVCCRRACLVRVCRHLWWEKNRRGDMSPEGQPVVVGKLEEMRVLGVVVVMQKHSGEEEK